MTDEVSGVLVLVEAVLVAVAMKTILRTHHSTVSSLEIDHHGPRQLYQGHLQTSLCLNARLIITKCLTYPFGLRSLSLMDQIHIWPYCY